MRRRGSFAHAIGMCALVAALTAPAVASASDGGDTVFLKSGGILRGSVIEYDPAREVRLKLADGEVRTVDASLVARVLVGADDPASTPEASTAPLHVEGPPEVAIFGRPNDGSEWKLVCKAPCDERLRLDWQYRAGGSGIKDSASFTLVPRGDGMTVSVNPASKSGFVLGIVGLTAGANVGVVGLYLLLVDALLADGSGDDHGLFATGAAVTLLGAGLMVGGAVALFGNLSTHVTPTGQASEALPGPRLPTWHTAEARREVVLPAAFAAPVWTLAF